MSIHQLSEKNSISLKLNPKKNTKMKYSQASILKNQIDASIERLTKAVVKHKATEAARLHLAATHLSVNLCLGDNAGLMTAQQKMEELDWHVA